VGRRRWPVLNDSRGEQRPGAPPANPGRPGALADRVPARLRTRAWLAP